MGCLMIIYYWKYNNKLRYLRLFVLNLFYLILLNR